MIILSKLRKYQIHVLLFLFISLAYIFATGGNFWEYDSFAVYKLAKSLVDHGQFSISCFWGAETTSGVCYSRFGLLMSLAIVPMYVVEKFFLESLKNGFFFPGFFPSLTNCFITALISVVIYMFLCKLNFSKKLAVFGTFLFSFATYAPAYTKTLYAEPLLTLLSLLCFYLLAFGDRKLKTFLLAGFLFGTMFLAKISAVLFFPSILFLLLTKKSIMIKKAVFFLPVILLIVFLFAYNYLRFQNILRTGYDDAAFDMSLISGIYLFVISPGKSLILYQPIIFFAVFGMKRFFNKQRIIFLSFTVTVITHIFFYATYHWQAGEWAWGSRFLYVLLPFFIICLMYFLKNNRSVHVGVLFIFSLFLSLVVQVSSIYISYHRYYSFMNKKYGHDFSRLAYPKPEYSPLFGQWKMIFRLGYKETDDQYWREAFQEYPNFQTNYKIASPDLFFLRSKKLILVLLTGCVVEFLLIKKIYDYL